MEEKIIDALSFDYSDFEKYCYILGTNLFDFYEYQIEESFRNGEFDHLVLRDMADDTIIINRILHTHDNYINKENSKYYVFSEETEIFVENNFTEEELRCLVTQFKGKIVDDDVILYRDGYIGFEFIYR